MFPAPDTHAPPPIPSKHRPRRRWPRALALGIGVPFAVIVILALLGACVAALNAGDPGPDPQPNTRLAAPAPARTAPTTPGLAAPPKGVSVSGPYADAVVIRSFSAKRDALDDFGVKLRLQNVTDDPIEFMSVKVTALRGETIVATADGLVETLAAGQTVTHEPISADDFPSNRAGITYEIELD